MRKILVLALFALLLAIPAKAQRILSGIMAGNPPSTPARALVTDSFTGNGALSAAWTTVTGWSRPVQSGGRAVVAAGDTNHGVYRNDATFANNQYAQVKWMVTAYSGSGPVVRASGNNFYYIYLSPGNSSWRLFKVVNGTATIVGSENYISMPSAGALLKLSVTGSTFTFSINGTPQSPTESDSSVASGAPGFMLYNSDAAFDDFEGGDL